MGRYADTLRERIRLAGFPPKHLRAPGRGILDLAPKKGRFDGQCNRMACQKPINGANWWNSSTRAYYCRDCAREINKWARRDDGIVICTAVNDINDRPAYPERPSPVTLTEDERCS